MNKKSGVTLITLSIAVLIMAILATVVIVNVENIIPTAKATKVAEELKTIQDKLMEYYITHGNYPVLDNTTYTKNDVLNLHASGKKTELSTEITKNGDDAAVFFKIDMSKLRITSTLHGNETTVEDVFIAADTTGTVYYVKGFVAEGNNVFSLSYFNEK